MSIKVPVYSNSDTRNSGQIIFHFFFYFSICYNQVKLENKTLVVNMKVK